MTIVPILWYRPNKDKEYFVKKGQSLTSANLESLAYTISHANGVDP